MTHPRFRTFLALALTLAVLGPADVTAQQSIRGNLLPSHRMLRHHGLIRAWWGQATMDPSRERVAHMTIDENVVIVQSSGGTATAFDNESGRRLWAAQLGPQDAPSQPAVTNSNFAFVPTAKNLYCLDKFTGRLLWQLRLPRIPSTSPAVDESQIFYGSHDGSIYAFDLNRIRDLYEKNELSEWGFLARQWRFKTGREITTPPVASGRVVTFASRDNSVYSITTGSPRLQWQSETESPVSAPISHQGGFLYIACEDFNLYCLNAQNGNTRWQPFPSGFPIRRMPRVIGQHIFIFPDEGGIFCLSTATGKRIWWRKGLKQYVGSTGTRIFAADQVGNLVALRRTDGSILGTMPLRQFGIKYGNDRTDRIYLATNSGLIVCLRESGADHEFPVFHRNPDLLPIVPEFSPEEAPAPAPAPAPASNPDSGN
ncbi:MAG: pyrrolo-quinoline quinone [Planctomycetaceae bacterium]|jgi:outer membrane protein assembly factor BamB|nr:pyrrolo-quinoline quinone [Planctomycetaceae bacterium]MDP7275255.1 PQQ-binding-like beta-propeller repeat protein [Planctomycetaceae bacterium]